MKALYILVCAVFIWICCYMQHLVHLVKISRECVSFLLIVFERSVDGLPSLPVQNIGQSQLQVLEIFKAF